MNLNDSVVLVTGANRGLGRHFAEQLVQRGAKVYAGARRPETIDLPGVIPVALDITDPESVAQAVKVAGDVTVVVNNAGSGTGAALIDGDLDKIRLEMETHYFGTLHVTRAFAPVIEGNGGGAFLNVLSVLSWLHPGGLGAYTSAKAAEWALTDAVRDQLTPRGITVSALHVGYMDTDMAANIPADQKIDPAIVARLALDGVEAGRPEIIADELSRSVKQGLATALQG
ncbi:SDR family oxidoreductase [Actinoplanes friuliensis]|jgi:NAD(P)-dependent dehydrogenase (short-subunit alcohol dehydrogenase family)|uniref:Short chain dehydrogenase n=1 Tax=Actinoplanes friuliensis DSM 7358 TaxID=1246995 RepID=U5W2V6_9ACTN|nr:SDR family oxidoreductase [Actinoplanes friuliensis]AGZ42251.1 short chain dehydrogenase [Actinoplanes friuliensis DSM 7358]